MPELTTTLYLHIMLLYIMTNINLIFENIQLSSNLWSFFPIDFANSLFLFSILDAPSYRSRGTLRNKISRNEISEGMNKIQTLELGAITRKKFSTENLADVSFGLESNRPTV